MLTLNIEDNFYPHLKAILDKFVETKQVDYVEEDYYDYENNYPESVVVSSVEEVRRRVALSEQEVSMTEEEYELIMNKFFKEELGVDR